MRSVPARSALAALLLPAALAAQDPQRITPSISLMPYVDPIDDTDHGAVMVSSQDGLASPARLGLDWRCYGRHVDVGLFFPAAVAGWERLVWRFDAEPPDTLPLEAEPPMRVYGRPGLWMALEKPLRLVPIPDSLKAAFTRRARGASRLVVRLDGPRRQRDWFFDLRGLSTALDRLSCVARPAPARATPPRVLGQPAGPTGPVYHEPRSLDVQPVPADSAAAAAALAREVPAAALGGPRVPSILAFVSISATGTVDSVDVVSGDGGELEEAAARFLALLRFTPGQRQGQPVPARISVYIQANDPRAEVEMP